MDEVDRPLGHHVARVVRLLAVEMRDDAVVVQIVLVVLDLHLHVPLVVAGRDAGREAGVAVQVLADEARAVAGVVQPGGERRAVVEDLGAAVGWTVVVDAGVV